MTFYVRGNIINTLDVPSVKVQDGTAVTPTITFANRLGSGMYRAGGGAVGVAVDGVEALRVTGNAVYANAFVGDGSQLTGLNKMSISNVQITDSSWNLLDATALSNSGGYCVVNGSGFTGTVNALVGASVAPTSLTTTSPAQLRMVLPSLQNGTYPLWVFSDQYSTVKVNALNVSPVPIWSTAAALSNVTKYVSFTQSLLANEPLGSTIAYALANGSSLPPNVSLTSTGLLSGNILEDPGNTTTYSFVVEASDDQYQRIPRTFGLTALIATITATGGTITYSGVYTIHTFTTSGTFALSSNPVNRTFEVLVVAGGGSGGTIGGGGGGGVIYTTSIPVANGTYAITVGGGGNNSQFSSYTAIAGGSGGGNSVGSNGGSGGGGGAYVGGGYGGGTGTGGQGNSGGSGGWFNSQYRCGGGGGGAGTVGGNAVQSDRGAAGSGGSGIQVWGTYYGGGGGGSTTSGQYAGYAGGGGLGGGGQGVGLNVVSPTAGTGNTGGGGGGGGDGAGAAGGSGIVIIRYIP